MWLNVGSKLGISSRDIKLKLVIKSMEVDSACDLQIIQKKEQGHWR